MVRGVARFLCPRLSRLSQRIVLLPSFTNYRHLLSDKLNYRRRQDINHRRALQPSLRGCSAQLDSTHRLLKPHVSEVVPTLLHCGQRNNGSQKNQKLAVVCCRPFSFHRSTQPTNGTRGGDQFHRKRASGALAGMGSTCTCRRRVSRVGTESARGTSLRDEILLEAASEPLALKSRTQRGPLRDSATGEEPYLRASSRR